MLGLLAIGLVAPATVARAHAQLVESSPNHGAVVDDAPATIELRFNETVLAIPGAVVLRSGDSEIPGRTRVEGTTLTFTPTGPVPDGTAVLDWRSTSEDGHVIGGKLVFH